MRMVADGRAGLTDRMRRHLELCLDCRACETACPSGVRYGRLIEPFRLAMEQADPRPELKYDWFRSVILFGLFPYAERMRRLLAPVRLAQQIGLFDAAERLGLLKLIPGRLGRMLPLLPPPSKPGPKLPRFVPAVGRKRARVAFFVGCVADAMFRPTHWATLRVLQQNGCDIFIPPEQGCCGAIHFHAGDSRGARRMADANLVAFELDRYDAIVVNHGGCGAMMKEYGLHWRDGLQPHREKFAAKVKDVNEFLDALGMVAPSGRIDAVATYHDACHLGHAQGIMAAPRRLLAKIPGLELPGPGGDGHLLRLGRNLQSPRSRNVGPPRPAEDREHSPHRRPHRAGQQRRLPAANPAGSAAAKARAAGDAPDGSLDLSYRGEQPG